MVTETDGLVETQSFLLKRKNEKSYMEAISSLAYSSRASYKSVLHRFEEFCIQNYNGRSADEIVAELKSIPLELRDDAYFGVLQEYVNWLVKRNLSSRSITNNFTVVNHYFSYQGIRAHPSDLRQNVKRPKEIREKLHPLTLEEIHKIFAYSPKKRRMLYLLLIGTGMRIRECVSLRKRDFHLDSPQRIRIEIPAQFTKTKTAHTTFVSKEAAGYLIPHLSSIGPDNLVFATNQDPYHGSMTEIEAFSRYRGRAGLTAKYASSNRHQITLHSFRSYFFTRARRAHDTDIAHAMVGHTTYLDMYDRKDDLEKLQLYRKIEPLLRINFKSNPEEEERQETMNIRAKSNLWSDKRQITKITTAKDFDLRCGSSGGFIIISDRKKGNKLHKTSCPWLKTDSFLEKVIARESKNGCYYWLADYDFAKIGLSFRRCSVCCPLTHV